MAKNLVSQLHRTLCAIHNCLCGGTGSRLKSHAEATKEASSVALSCNDLKCRSRSLARDRSRPKTCPVRRFLISAKPWRHWSTSKVGTPCSVVSNFCGPLFPTYCVFLLSTIYVASHQWHCSLVESCWGSCGSISVGSSSAGVTSLKKWHRVGVG